MLYFDNEYLKQYLEKTNDLQVFVDKRYLFISDESDLEDPKIGIGYDKFGAPKEFEYTNIIQIKIGETIFTRDQLNDKFGQAPPEEKKSSGEPSSSDTKGGEDKLSLDAPEQEKKPKESLINKYIKNADPKSPYYGTRGTVISESNGVVIYKTYTDGSYQSVSCLIKHIQDG